MVGLHVKSKAGESTLGETITRESPLDTVRVIRHTWIKMSDGCRLGARLWLPESADDERVPAILEYIPYRKSDLMAPEDARVGPWFAEHGYAYVRVDLRGAGDSEGVLLDEYLPQEQDDALEVLAWIEAQPWCTGSVGMIGYSWGGFNGLQIAARRPPQLKAVISMYSSDDRYADDVHYLGGCLNAADQLPWASVMLPYLALPPDPAAVGDAWRDMWLSRLRETPPHIDAWMTHQRRDDYWKHGSVCEDYGAIECPVYMVGGWADGYTNAVMRYVERHQGVCKGLIGPWAHGWPKDVAPGPSIGFLQECIRWWDRWLKGVENGIDEEPQLRVWMQEPYRPEVAHEAREGRWVVEKSLPSPRIERRRLYLDDDSLADEPAEEAPLTHRGVHRHGALAGSWCPYGHPGEFPSDQREEDALCLTFTSQPLPERVELLGRPRLRLACSVDKPLALVAARLTHISPDGTSTLVSRSALNLTHLNGHAEPKAMTPGSREIADFELDVVGQAIPAGNRLRLSLSTTYWPWLWPSPEQVELTVFTGPGSFLDLPVRPPDPADDALAQFQPPEQSTGLAYQALEYHPGTVTIRRDPIAGTIELDRNTGGNSRLRYVESETEITSRSMDRYSIQWDDPLTARLTCERVIGLARGSWDVRVETTSTMTSDLDSFHLDDTLEAYEGPHRVFVKTWSRSIPRDHL